MNLSFLFPHKCIICGNRLCGNESFVCRHCDRKLPRTDFHKIKANEAEQLFFGKCEIEKAASFCYYYSGAYFQNAVHEMKYGNNPRLAYKAASFYAEELLSFGWFSGIDAVVPVPVHFFKEIKRGYNQSHWIAKAISDTTGIPLYSSALKKIVNNKSQTDKNTFLRYENTSGAYKARALSIPSNILIVDDVLTSGATVFGCTEAVKSVNPECRISVLSLGFAK